MLFAGAEPPSLRDNRAQHDFRWQFAVLAQRLDQAMFSEFFPCLIWRFG